MSLSSFRCCSNKSSLKGDLLGSAIFKTFFVAHLITVLLFATGCQSVYYQTMEKLGYQKREILIDRVEDARDVQEEAKEQFQSALEEFSSVVNFSGGELERKYEALNAEFTDCKSKANAVRDRIVAVEDVAEAHPLALDGKAENKIFNLGTHKIGPSVANFPVRREYSLTNIHIYSRALQCEIALHLV